MSTYNFIISQAKPDDIDTLRQMSIDTFTDTYAEFNTKEDMQLHLSREFNRKHLLDELLDIQNFYFIASVDNEAAGYIKLRTAKQPETLQDKSNIELERIYVLKKYQGSGLGKLLIEQCIKIATEKGYNVLWLGVWKQNEKAIMFYKKCGFSIFGEQVFTLGSDPQSDWLMMKELKDQY